MRAALAGNREYAEGLGATSVERYEIVRTLSQSGLADLFLARETTCVGVDRLVVLKRLRLKYAEEPDYLAMFLDECRLALRLEHPRIVRAYGVDHWAGRACLVLEYLQGVDAGTLIAHDVWGAALGIESALTIGHAIADALAYVHVVADHTGEPRGIVHRDISPDNLFLCRDGSVKLMDFGVAAFSRCARRNPRGALKGKYAYMSPEQCRDEPLDGRSDLFSLGIVLYELTTGQRPFRATRSSEVVSQIISQPIRPPRSLDPAYPADLERLLVRMLDKDRARRPGSAAEVREALVAISRRLGCTLTGCAMTGLVEKLSSAPEPAVRREPSHDPPAEVAVADAPLEDPVVLVVDDEESFHAVAKNRLRAYRRIAAYSALQALDALAAHSVDVVLLDLNLPDRSGLDILEELRLRAGNVAVIVCTGEADVGMAVECMKRGAYDFMVKTHESFAVLDNRVQSALRHRASAPAIRVGTR